MGYKTLELTLISAKDLKNVNLIGKMDVYVVVQLSDEPKSKQKTPVHTDGGTNPSWNYTMRFNVDEAAAAKPGKYLTFTLKHESTFGDKDLGVVLVSLKELFDSVNPKDPTGPQFLTYQVRRSSGKAQGELKFSVKFIDMGQSSAGHDAYKGSQSCSSSSSAAAPYPPPHAAAAYPPPHAAAAYPPPHQASGAYPPPQHTAAGYPAHEKPPVGYPAQSGAIPYAAPYGAPQGYPAYGGYPPQGAAGYGYPAPGGYPAYPPAGYAQPQNIQNPKKKKSGFGMGLGAGLLGGALGGLVLGEAMDDAFDGGDYGGDFAGDYGGDFGGDFDF